MEFETRSVFEALKTPLGLVDDAERRQALERYVEAARLPLERAVFDLMAAMAAAIEQRLGGRYRVRLTYRAGALELEVDEKEPAAPLTLADVEWTRGDGEMDKVTIRLPAELKELATRAAAGAGVSVNSWFVRALAGAVRGVARQDAEGVDEPGGPGTPGDERRPAPAEPRGRGARLTGWIGSE